MLCAKLGTKGIDGFVEVVLFLIGRALECSKLVTEFLDGFLESRYFFRLMEVDKNRSGIRKAWCEQTYLSSFAVHESLHAVT